VTKYAIGFLALLLALSLPMTVLGCGIEAWNLAALGGIPRLTNRNWTFGEVFVANQDIRVNFLGCYAAEFSAHVSHSPLSGSL
jgi:hypothetical protein